MTQLSDDFRIRHLARVVASSDDAIVSKDLNGTILSWNPGAERIFGFTEQEAVGNSIRMIIPDDLQSEEDLVLARLRAGERIDHYRTTRRRKDGTLISIELTVSPIRGESGTMLGATKIARDVTDRVRLEQLAQERALLTAKISEVGATLTSSLDRDTVVQKVTDAATELTGAEFGAFFYNVRDEHSGDAYMLYTLSGAPKEAFSRFPHPRATAVFGPTFRGEATVRLSDVTRDPRYGRNAPHFGMPAGHLPVRSYLAVPVKGRSDEVLGGLFFGHSQADQFTEHHEQLAEGIATWAAVALENVRLYVEARTANQLKDEFLAVLSHELRTPLNAILGYARLLRGGILTGEKSIQALDTLERNATSLTQIVDDVLDVSRIVAGKIRLDVQAVEMPVVVANAVATVQPAADAKGVRVQTVIDPRVGPVSGDPSRLQQVLWNLVSNAVKFTPKGGRVQVRLERVDSHVDTVVSDNGAGIEPQFLPYVFDRFRQADSGTTRKTGGLGLGLAIVRHIVEMHGGTVSATSSGPGQGATFRVRLPLMIVHGDLRTWTGEHPRVERPVITRQLGDLSGLDILAIDDEADSLGLLRAVLEAAGAEVTTVNAPLAAIDRIRVVQPDAVIIDLGMPDLDGFALIGQIRTSDDPLIRHIPAAALTAFARSDDRTKALRSGFDMHLAKPIDPAELVASIATLVRRAPRER